MSKLFESVEKRMKEVYELEQDATIDNTLKTFTIRVPLDLLEKLDDISTIMQMKRSELARMILADAAEDIIEKYKISTGERIGASFEQMYEFEQASPEEKEQLLKKWQAEAAAKKGGE